VNRVKDNLSDNYHLITLMETKVITLLKKKKKARQVRRVTGCSTWKEMTMVQIAWIYSITLTSILMRRSLPNNRLFTSRTFQTLAI